MAWQSPSAMNNVAGGVPEANGPAGTEYTLQGVMRFLQLEWHRYERERNAWDIERAEMKAKIAKQEGESRSSKKLNDQLNRQIRMLEKALKNERIKKSAAPEGSEANEAEQEKDVKNKAAEASEASRATKTTKRALCLHCHVLKVNFQPLETLTFFNSTKQAA
ncbi:MAG: hypothetical protein Q9157_006569 [Trypethelium eluteriae]